MPIEGTCSEPEVSEEVLHGQWYCRTEEERKVCYLECSPGMGDVTIVGMKRKLFVFGLSYLERILNHDFYFEKTVSRRVLSTKETVTLVSVNP